MKTRPTLIFNALVTRPGREPFPGGALIEGGRIAAVFHGAPGPAGRGAVGIDAGGGFLAPGLLDLHVHGGGGGDFLHSSPAALERIVRFHYRFGVTGLLFTFSASPPEAIASAAAAIKKFMARSPCAPSFLGINLEGPFLSPSRAGAQPSRDIVPPSPELLKRLLDSAGGMVKLMTIAPEIEGVEKLIPLIKRAGVIPAIGHTQADYGATLRALKAGVSYATHVFNAYPPLHHRDPGPLGAIFESGRVDTEIIADGIHVKPPVLRILFRLQPLERVILVSDAVASAAEAAGDQAVRLPGGTLAGGGRGLSRGVWNLVRWIGLPPQQALVPATINPARVLGVDRGDLKEGFPADLTIWSSRGELRGTLVAGKPVYLKR